MTFALLAVLVQQQAHAQAIAVPAGAFTGSINAAVWNSIAANLARRGLAVSAAAAVSTETAIGLAASALSYGSAALTGVVGIATSPVWLTVAAGAGVLAGIHARKAGYRIVSTALVVNESGARLMADALRFRFDRARELAAVPKDAFQFRDLRAKAGTDKTESAGDIRAAQRQLGHKSLAMTEHYVRERKGDKVDPTR